MFSSSNNLSNRVWASSLFTEILFMGIFKGDAAPELFPVRGKHHLLPRVRRKHSFPLFLSSPPELRKSHCYPRPSVSNVQPTRNIGDTLPFTDQCSRALYTVAINVSTHHNVGILHRTCSAENTMACPIYNSFKCS